MVIFQRWQHSFTVLSGMRKNLPQPLQWTLAEGRTAVEWASYPDRKKYISCKQLRWSFLWAHNTHIQPSTNVGFITAFQQFHQGSSALSRCPLWCFQSQRLLRRTWCACGFALALGGSTSNVAQNLDLLKGPSESKLSMVVNIMWIHFAMAATVWCTKTYVSVSGTKLGVARRCPTPDRLIGKCYF